MASNKTAGEILKEANPKSKKTLPPKLAKLTYSDLKTLQDAFASVRSQGASAQAFDSCCCCCTAVSASAPNCSE